MLVLLVEHQLVVVLRRVQLALLVPDAELAEHALHAEGARLVRHDRDDALADVLVAQQRLQDLHERHRGRDLAVLGALEEAVEGRERGNLQRQRLAPPRRQVAAQLHAPRAHVLEFLAALGELHQRDFFQLVVRHRDLEAVAEAPDRLERHLLLLVRDVLRLARLAHPVALDGLGEDDGRLPLVVHRAVERRVHLVRVVAAAIQVPDLLVRPVGDEFLQLRRVEEVLADVGAVLRLEGLVLAVDRFHHPADEDALGVAREQRVPVHAPHELDDVPAGAAEVALEFLDDLAVAAHRSVEALQVAVDDEDQVVQRLARGHADRAHRLRLVHLAVAAEAPDLASLGLREPAILQVLHEARLVDRHQRSQAHRHGRELPEVGHQPGMRIARDPLAVDLLPEVVELLVGQATEQVRARVDAGGGMALHEDEVAAVLVGGRVPEMVEADVVQRRGGGEARDVPADVRVLVRAQRPSPSSSSARTSGSCARSAGRPGCAPARASGSC